MFPASYRAPYRPKTFQYQLGIRPIGSFLGFHMVLATQCQRHVFTIITHWNRHILGDCLQPKPNERKLGPTHGRAMIFVHKMIEEYLLQGPTQDGHVNDLNNCAAGVPAINGCLDRKGAWHLNQRSYLNSIVPVIGLGFRRCVPNRLLFLEILFPALIDKRQSQFRYINPSRVYRIRIALEVFKNVLHQIRTSMRCAVGLAFLPLRYHKPSTAS